MFLEKERIKEILACMEIQIKKYEDARDIVDIKLVEMSVAMDAIRYDYESLKKVLNEAT